ncbi:hypothetical protein MMC21_007138 [Puttea exsequens]|nr:hypothetical protein [Puttea exsequens]
MSSPIKSIWQKWKSLKLPWRRHWLAGIFSPPNLDDTELTNPLLTSTGSDLAGNTYWYFAPTGAAIPRRIMRNNPQIPYSDLDISPMWHQWLRHTRRSPPSLHEQRADVTRQIQLKHNAQLADARWSAKPRLVDAPRRGNLEVGVGDGEVAETVGGQREEGRMSVGKGEKEKREGEKTGWSDGRRNPGRRDSGVAGEGWQPEAWTPGAARR